MHPLHPVQSENSHYTISPNRTPAIAYTAWYRVPNFNTHIYTVAYNYTSGLTILSGTTTKHYICSWICTVCKLEECHILQPQKGTGWPSSYWIQNEYPIVCVWWTYIHVKATTAIHKLTIIFPSTSYCTHKSGQSIIICSHETSNDSVNKGPEAFTGLPYPIFVP